jgi:hypothetical protein
MYRYRVVGLMLTEKQPAGPAGAAHTGVPPAITWAHSLGQLVEEVVGSTDHIGLYVVSAWTGDWGQGWGGGRVPSQSW